MKVKRRFVVGIDQETSEDTSSFIEYIRQQGFGWWHWIDNFWLLTTRDTQVRTTTLRNKLKEITGGKTVIVMEVKSTKWATYGPSGEGDSPNISKWLNSNWKMP